MALEAHCYVQVLVPASEKHAMDGGVDAGVDPAEEVGRVSAARRGRLLRIYRRRLRFEDLEDCYSQATLELVARSRRNPFESRDHLANALELRFRSRIEDRRRAIEGRSGIEAAIARAVPVDAGGALAAELEDRGAAVERQVLARTEMRRLREVIADLSRDQQLVLASQVLVDMGPSEFCDRHGWSIDKYRKVAQRARGKLRRLVDEYECGERCRRLEPDLLALSAGIASGDALGRARAHVANCPACARMVGDLERAARSVAALLPLPAAAAGGIAARLAGLVGGVRRAAGLLRHPLAEAGGGGAGAGVAGGSLVSTGALKVGIAAVCVAGAAGGYAACARLGVLPPLAAAHVVHHVARRERAPHAPTRRRVDLRERRQSRTRRSVRERRRAATHAAAPAASVVVATAPVAPVPAGGWTAARADAHVRLTTVEQVAQEFGRPPRGGVASAGGSGRALAAAARRTARVELGQIRREFGRPAVRVASAAPPAAKGRATVSGGTARGGGVATVASSGVPPPATPPAQSGLQAVQTGSEFGFER